MTDFEPSAPPLPPRNNRRGSLGRSLARGGIAFMGAVGDFFGVTEQSQAGTADAMGWREVHQRIAEDSGGFGLTLRRRSSQHQRTVGFLHSNNEAPPPDYNNLEMGAVQPSFNAADLSDSDSDSDVFAEAGLLSEAPPDYFSVAQTSTVVQSNPDTSRVSVYGPDNPEGAASVPALVPVMEYQSEPIAVASEPADANFIYGVEEGYQYYMSFLRAEKALRQRRQREAAGEFFGEGRANREGGGGPQRSGSIRRGRLNSVDNRRRRRRGKTKLERQNTIVRDQLASLPTFWPILIVGLTFLQLVATGVLIYLRGLETIHILPQHNVGFFPSLSAASGNESVEYLTLTNMWIGMRAVDLIQIGAIFPPCMRQDFAIQVRNTARRANETMFGGLGCCSNGNTTWLGTSIRSGENTTAHPELAPTCSPDGDYIANQICNSSDRLRNSINFRPCCISLTGECRVMHQQECLARRGIPHNNLDNCNQTNCLNSLCGFNGVGDIDGDPVRPVGNQGWRLLLALFIHIGAIHAVLILAVQLYLGVRIERAAGFLRVALIYLISGVGGYLVSSIFIPYGVTAGASPAVCGLLAVLYVELIQSSRIVERAWLELIKLIVITIFLLAIGTLPYTDNLANIAGFVFGLPSALIFLPYITFSKTGLWVKRILLIICIPLLIVMFLVGFIMFYLIRRVDFCFFCHYLSCVPYVTELCSAQPVSANDRVFAL